MGSVGLVSLDAGVVTVCVEVWSFNVPSAARASGEFGSGAPGVGVVGVGLGLGVVTGVAFDSSGIGFFHHLDVVVGAMGDYVGKETQPDVAFSFRVGFAEWIGGKRIVEDMALFEEIVEPNASAGRGHGGFEIGNTSGLGDASRFLRLANVFA